MRMLKDCSCQVSRLPPDIVLRLNYCVHSLGQMILLNLLASIDSKPTLFTCTANPLIHAALTVIRNKSARALKPTTGGVKTL